MPTVFSRFAPCDDPDLDLVKGIIQNLDVSNGKTDCKEPLCRLSPDLPDNLVDYIGQFFRFLMHPWAFEAWKEYKKLGWNSWKIWMHLAKIARVKQTLPQLMRSITLRMIIIHFLTTY